MKLGEIKVALLFLCLCYQTAFGGILDFLPFTGSLMPNTTTENAEKTPLQVQKSKGLDFGRLVQRHGYRSEEHRVQTPDGYRLIFHRIPGSPRSPKSAGKPVVYIQHGLFGSSDMFVVAGPNKDLPYILADAGYDVWLGNARGNTYGRLHVKMNPDSDTKFWEFSMHEIALYDISTTINYILKATKQPNIIYVGHSMGTTMSLILLSTKPEFNKKIRLVINMASVGNWKNTRNFMRFAYNNGVYITPAINAAGITEVFPRSFTVGEFENSTCRDGGLMQDICLNIVQYISGYNTDLLDKDLMTEAMLYFPAGASWQTMYHFYQNIIKGQLQMYDYGIISNYFRYGRTTPPVYNLANVVVPIFMLYGKNDVLAAPEDSLELAKILKNARAESVSHEKFTHLDFVWSKNVENLVHKRVLDVITKFTTHGRDLGDL